MHKKQQGSGEWLIPFRGRNDSGAFDQNFLYRDNSVYVMDNHRAATWCWLQHVDHVGRPHSLLHIDQHYDCASARIAEVNCLLHLRDDLSIDEYLGLNYEDGPLSRLPIFRWDNYLSVYLAGYGGLIKHLRMCTHDRDTKPDHPFEHGDLWDIPQHVDDWLDRADGPWILNLDLDYFFWRVIGNEQPGLMVSNDYLTTSFKKIQKKIEDQTIAVTTIALTPQCGLTGGWGPAERLAKFILDILGIDFELPTAPQ